MQFGQQNIRSLPSLHDIRCKKNLNKYSSHDYSKTISLDIDNVKKITEDNLQNIISRDPKADRNIKYNIIDECITKAIKMCSKSKTAKINRRKHKRGKRHNKIYKY